MILLPPSPPPKPILLAVFDPSTGRAWDGAGRAVRLAVPPGGKAAALRLVGKSGRVVVVRFEPTSIGVDRAEWRSREPGATGSALPMVPGWPGSVAVKLRPGTKRLDLSAMVPAGAPKTLLEFDVKDFKPVVKVGKELYPGVMHLRPGDDFGPNGPLPTSESGTTVRTAVRHRPIPSRPTDRIEARAWMGGREAVEPLGQHLVAGKFMVEIFAGSIRSFKRFRLQVWSRQEVRLNGIPTNPRD